MPERSNTLTLHDVTKRYGSGKAIIEGFNATFTSGEGIGLIGPNGSGKTTLMRLLATQAFPSSGQILFNDAPVHQHPYRYLKHVGMAFDDNDLPEYLSAPEVLELILRQRGKWDATSSNRISTLLDKVELDDRRDTLIGTYSTGMRKKIQVAMALCSSPEVLLLDEPFRGLDDSATKAVIQLLETYLAHQGVLIISSHQKQTLDSLCTRYVQFPLN